MSIDWDGFNAEHYANDRRPAGEIVGEWVRNHAQPEYRAEKGVTPSIMKTLGVVFGLLTTLSILLMVLSVLAAFVLPFLGILAAVAFCGFAYLFGSISSWLEEYHSLRHGAARSL